MIIMRDFYDMYQTPENGFHVHEIGHTDTDTVSILQAPEGYVLLPRLSVTRTIHDAQNLVQVLITIDIQCQSSFNSAFAENSVKKSYEYTL